MISKINFKNYKAFKCGEINLKPITILLGANSVGKSSIMQLILMLQQTVIDSSYKSAFRLHGGHVNLGEGKNLVYQQKTENILEVGFEFEDLSLTRMFNEGIGSGINRDLYFIYSTILHTLGSVGSNRISFRKAGKKSASSGKVKNILHDVAIEYEDINTLEREPFLNLIDEIEKLINEHPNINMDKIFQNSYYIFNSFANAKVNSSFDAKIRFVERKSEFVLLFDYFREIKYYNLNSKFNIDYSLAVTDKAILIKKVELKNKSKIIYGIEFDVNGDTNSLKYIYSDFFKKIHLDDGTYFHLKSLAKSTGTIFSFVREEEPEGPEFINSILCSTFINLMSQVNEAISKNFKNDNINYVSPLRAHPKRYYFLDKSNNVANVNTFDGDAIAEILKENSVLSKKVNKWLERFNLHADVKHLHNIIHRLVIRQNSLDLDITDVGFGISQILPVIIQGLLSKKKSLTLIEQPEIHLHPKMQAELADLFCDIALEDSKIVKYLLIETHSEYLLKRLRRRISEGSLSKDMVSIYLVNPSADSNGSEIKELPISESGQFEWPVDFYGGDLLEDTVVFLKNQI